MLDIKYILATFPSITLVAIWVALVYGVWATHLWSDFRADIRMLPLIVAIPCLALAIALDHAMNMVNYITTDFNYVVSIEFVLGKITTKIGYTIGLLVMLYTYWKLRLNIKSWQIPRCIATWLIIMAATYYGSFKLLCWLQEVV